VKRIPVPTPNKDNLVTVAAALKSNVDMSTGQHQNAPALKALDPTTATTADIVNTINLLIRRIQGDA
jgi:hypothetical protein